MFERLARLPLLRLLGREILTFGAIGVMSTLVFLGLFAGFRTALDAQAANVLALVLSAVFNTTANRRLTFGVRGREGLVAHQAAGLAAFGLALALTSGAIALQSALLPGASRLGEMAVLVVANAVATILRFLMLRAIIRRPARLPVAA